MVLCGVFTLAVIFALEYHDVHNEIAHQDNQHSTNIKVNSDETQIVYWTIIKRDPVGRQCVSYDVADTRTVYVPAQYVPLQAELTFTATGCKLTYAQVVYWIDPVLTAIDQANNQLYGIRRTESIYSSQ
ncbi:hypothetical protein [Pectobacterium odoriferum]|uniref:hypothetical protein n=1 Tax=Pectobacterium odoriferum TaxID=78398 RepID=UPI00052A3F8F|nr:hypothetical protein [Pectobacterium odoriferum]AIU88375.1 hypothetical protein BCS7_09680 [Pectobacterium odoriferum]POE20526.1 hypothetical protein BV918_02345 [Pectobacterium odoriferum]POE37246.1 hypothetical protein BV922_02340 [Pectobacterium odoriferum]